MARLQLNILLKALLYSLERNRDLSEILANITGGNIRAVIEFVTKFIGSPNVEAEKIIRAMSSDGFYKIPLHEFSKAAILGDYSHYNPESSLALNVFDVTHPDEREHFLCLLIIAFLLSESGEKDRNGFFSTGSIVSEMQRSRFTQSQSESALRRLTNKRLIETTERITFEEDITGLIGDMPFGFRCTTVGAYHLHKWAGNFAYLDGMVFDTPIFSSAVSDAMQEKLESFMIADRFERASAFRQYLTDVWLRSGIGVPYFNWHELIGSGQFTFDMVQRAVDRSRNSSGGSNRSNRPYRHRYR